MCVLQSLTGPGMCPVPPASSRFWSDRQLDSEGLLFAVTRVIDRGIHHVIDSVHQTGHVLTHNTHRHHSNILMHFIEGNECQMHSMFVYGRPVSHICST